MSWWLLWLMISLPFFVLGGSFVLVGVMISLGWWREPWETGAIVVGQVFRALILGGVLIVIGKVILG